MVYDNIAGVIGTYDEKYRYVSTTVFEEDGGEDLSENTSTNSLAPLESNTVYYLIEVPAEAENGPVVVEIYIGGQEYMYTIG